MRRHPSLVRATARPGSKCLNMTETRRTISVLLFVLPILCFSLRSALALEIRVRLLPEHSGAAVPISVRTDDDVPDSSRYCLRDSSTGRRVPFQYDRSSRTIEFVVDASETVGPALRTYRLVPGTPVYGDGMRIEDMDGKSLVIREGDKPLLVYNYRSRLPDGVNEKYRRSCYFHPVYGPYGEVLTDDFPADHFHHRGLAVMWTHVTVGEKDYDLWGINGMRARLGKVLGIENGPIYSLLKVRHGWYTVKSERVVDETWTVKAYRESGVGRVVDFDILLEAVGEPVSIRSSDRGYGGLNVRFSPREDTVLYNDKGRLPADCDKEPFLWSDLSATFRGAEAVSGVSIFDNPGNVRHPQTWSNRYYGVLNPAPAVEPLIITKDQPLHLSYRIWIHAGDIESGRVRQAYDAYVNPPLVEIRNR